MSLTDLKAKGARPAEKDYKLADSGGLYLYVTKTGYRSWRLKFRHGGKEKRLVIGPYPDVSLAEARVKRDEARRALRDGRGPALEAKKKRLVQAGGEQTFEAFARRWHKLQAPRWASVHAADVLRSLERDAFPELGAFPITDIDAPMVLACLRKVEKRGAFETARRLRQRLSGVFVFAISEGLATSDPAAVVTRALQPARPQGKQPALLELDALRRLIADVDAADAHPGTRLASRLLALTLVRPGVIRGATWDEFEGIDWKSDAANDPVWRVPASRMKLKAARKADKAFDHIVPLSPQAVAVLRAARVLSGHLDLLFPNTRHAHRPMSENAIGYLYNRAGYHARHVPHGWRAAFSTIMNERAERAGRAGDRAVIELILAHEIENRVEGAYNRAGFMQRRRELLGEWADLIGEGQVEPMQLGSGLID